MTAAERATARAEESAPPPPNPFQAELKRALADIRAALGTDKATCRAPLGGGSDPEGEARYVLARQDGPRVHGRGAR